MQRYFAINEKLEISKDDKYHITKVMRMKKDDHIEIVWNKEVFLCNLDVVNSSEVVYSVCKKLSVNNEPEIYVTLAFSLVNETKTDFILQKGVELGISEFIPVSASRSKVKIDIFRSLAISEKMLNTLFYSSSYFLCISCRIIFKENASVSSVAHNYSGSNAA